MIFNKEIINSKRYGFSIPFGSIYSVAFKENSYLENTLSEKFLEQL
jgi:hypothetical protein